MIALWHQQMYSIRGTKRRLNIGFTGSILIAFVAIVLFISQDLFPFDSNKNNNKDLNIEFDSDYLEASLSLDLRDNKHFPYLPPLEGKENEENREKDDKNEVEYGFSEKWFLSFNREWFSKYKVILSYQDALQKANTPLYILFHSWKHFLI